MYYFTEYKCIGTNGQTGSRTNASRGCGTGKGTHGRETSATDECQPHNSSPSKTYTYNIY